MGMRGIESDVLVAYADLSLSFPLSLENLATGVDGMGMFFVLLFITYFQC